MASIEMLEKVRQQINQFTNRWYRVEIVIGLVNISISLAIVTRPESPVLQYIYTSLGITPLVYAISLALCAGLQFIRPLKFEVNAFLSLIPTFFLAGAYLIYLLITPQFSLIPAIFGIGFCALVWLEVQRVKRSDV